MANSLAMLAISGLTLWLLAHFAGRAETSRGLSFPVAFLASTALLATGSFAMRRARAAVSQERQTEFRNWLRMALVSASLFVGVQGYALWAMFPDDRSRDEVSLGVRPYLLIIALLHAVHFMVAALIVSFISARATTQRYDHEYHWGVSVCEWFWHALGIVWLLILGIFVQVLTMQ